MKPQASFDINAKLVWLKLLMEASQQEEDQPQAGHLCSPEQEESSDGGGLYTWNARIWARVRSCHVGIRKRCCPRQTTHSSPALRRTHSREGGMVKVSAMQYHCTFYFVFCVAIWSPETGRHISVCQ